MTTTAFHIEGNLISADLLPDILAGEMKGQQPADFGLGAEDKLEDEIAFVWSEARSRWTIFQGRLGRVPEGKPATTETREHWVMPVLELLGFQASYQAKAEIVDGQTFAISHRVGETVGDRPQGENLEDGETAPIHVVGCRQSLEKRPLSGTPRLSAHALVQEYLNRTEHLWGIATNGYQWRLLRDCSLMTRLTYVEFDLEQIFENENFADFRLFYKLFHRSRFPVGMEDSDQCLLEHYHQETVSQGGRVRDNLRDGVEQALKILGTGFVQHPKNEALRQSLSLLPEGEGLGERILTEPQFYRQLLMLIYRCLFLMVAESRNLLFAGEDADKAKIYGEYYGIDRLRSLAERPSYRREGFQDLWAGLKVTFSLFDESWRGEILGLSPLNGDLFGSVTLAEMADYALDNHDLLQAVRGLSLYTSNGLLRRVNYAALDVEELGSVYESLLDFTPRISVKGGIFQFDLVSGSDRKTTGSYYTPSELVAQLIKSALEPVIADALARVISGSINTLSPNPSPSGRGGQEDTSNSPLIAGEGLGVRSITSSTTLAGEGVRSKWEISPELAAKMKEVARDLRKKSTPSEKILWEALRNRRLENKKFRRQYPIGSFVVDFYCHELALIIEIDGSIHDLPDQQNRDRQRQELLESLGLQFVRVSSQAVETNLPQVLQTLTLAITQREKEVTEQTILPPSPLGRGAGGEGQSTAIGTGTGGEGLKAAKEAALLSLKICDPACGSGHFLLAAARRIGKELARVRTEEMQPSPEALRQAIRDVIQHCIYGVDLNPLAVDLCKVALWIEGFCKGSALNFLDHRIKCGNSLVGVMDLDVLKEGIPDNAFKPVTGDDKKLGADFKKRNKKEREQQGQLSLFEQIDFQARQGTYAVSAQALDRIEEVTPEGYKQKQQRYEQLRQDSQWWQDFSACNLWTAAFFMPLTEQNLSFIPTTETLKRLLREAEQREEREMAQGSLFADGETSKQTPFSVVQMVEKANRLAQEHSFFHWCLEFPEVFDNSPRLGGEGKGGFDCVLGNPPWETLQIAEKEFFAVRDPEIANAQNKAAREKLIKLLVQTNPQLIQAFEDAKHFADAQNKFIRESHRFPLTAVGKINTYAIFAELVREVINQHGRTGVIVPSGIATNDTTKKFFESIAVNGQLDSLFDFFEIRNFFIGTQSREPFCLLVIRGHRSNLSSKFIFKISRSSEINDQNRQVIIDPADFLLLNPNTKNCPIFRSSADAEITKKIYQKVPVLENETTGDNPWKISFKQGLFNMSSDSHLFNDEAGENLLPLYEAKMFHQFDHRFSTYEGATQANLNSGMLPQATPEMKEDFNFAVTPRYWVDKQEVENKLSNKWDKKWLLGFRDVTNSVSERTGIFSFLPIVAFGHKAPLVLSSQSNLILHNLLLANLCSLVLDFILRQKIGGNSFSFFILKQLPVIPPDRYSTEDIEFISKRVLELTYTAWDMKPFAEDMGYDGDPFVWDEKRRAIIRAELDAKYAKLYGLTRDELRYILDPADVYGADFPSETFRVLKNNEMKKYGEYRTQRLVLAAWDMMGY